MDADLIAPGEALARVLACVRRPGVERVALEDATGRVLARDVRARVDLPSFDNAAMDGWAVRAADTRGAGVRRPVRLEVVGEVFAGSTRPPRVRAGRAVAVMTGAPLPPGADAVVPFENARAEGGVVVIEAPVAAGRHVRRRGGDVRRGQDVLARGTRLGAAAIAALAAQGIATVAVARRPRVAVIATGDELVAPGARLGAARVYDSVGPALRALVGTFGGHVVGVTRVGDTVRELDRALGGALARADVVITVGGVSCGRRDPVPDAWRGAGVRARVAGVAQKPGKPMRFGTRGRVLVFALPGNPVSAYVTACLYVLPALDRLAGGAGAGLPALRVRLASAVRRDAARWRFVRARRLADGRVSPLAAQGSHQVTHLPRAEVLVEVAPGRGVLRPGARVVARILPGAPGGTA